MARERISKTREGNEIEFSRIVAFSDGVFSIAITLLVLNLGIGKGVADGDVASALWDQREQLVAYGISFAVIGRFWLVHHRFFSDVTGFDGRLIALNLFYLSWVVLIPFSSEVLGEHGGVTASVVLYSTNLAGVVGVGLLMASYARRAGLTSVDAAAHGEQRLRSIYTGAVFALSIPIAFLAPNVVPYLWLALFFDPRGRLGAIRGRR